jgi:NAD(P)-dependent dehydrogenase (short-subunit alcohol dehydrogenase family)
MVFATMRDIGGRNSANAGELLRIAKNEALSLHVLTLDVTDDSSVQSAVEQAIQGAGRIDVVINNAGSPAIGVTEAFTPAQFQTLFNVNVLGSVRVNRAVLPGMRRQRSGLLIHVTSAAARVSVPYMAPYCASKFALEAIADAYRFELSPFGIDSVVVEPGIFKTPIFDKTTTPLDNERAAEYGAADYSERVIRTFDAAMTARDATDPREVVDLFASLIETPAGERPFRTIAGSRVKPLLASYNQAAEQISLNTMQTFRLTELVRTRKAPADRAEELDG